MSVVEDRIDLLAELGRSDADRRLLRSMRSPRSCQGLYPALVQVESALEDYFRESTLPRVGQWLEVCRNLIDRCEQMIDQGNVSLALASPSDSTPVFSVLAAAPRGVLNEESQRRSRLLLAMILLAACARREVADGPAVAAWATLQRLAPHRPGTAADWKHVAADVPVTADTLQQALAHAVTPGLQDLLAGALTAIRRPLMEPATKSDAPADARTPSPVQPYPSAELASDTNCDEGLEPEQTLRLGDSTEDLKGHVDACSEESGPAASLQEDDGDETLDHEPGVTPGATQQGAVDDQKTRRLLPCDSRSRRPRDDSLARANPVGWLIKGDNQSRHGRRFDLIGEVDRLHPRSTQQVWQRLMVAWQDAGPEDRARVVLAHLSQRSALPARLALQLRLDASQSLRIDVADGSVIWDYRAALNSAGADPARLPTSATPTHEIRLCLDAEFAQALRLYRSLRPRAETVAQLLGIDDSEAALQQWLTDYRSYLRLHGESQHPPYDARFARSLADVYRHSGAAEIVVMLAGLDFASMPLGMLHYVALPSEMLVQADRKVFEFLGWRWPRDRTDATSTWIGGSQPAQPQAFRDGWAELQGRTRQAMADVRHSAQPDELVEAFNRLATCRLLGFLTLVGHRGSRLSRLTRRSLFAWADALHIYDKSVGDYQSDRLVPAHAWVDQLLSAWQADSKLLLRRAEALGVGLSLTGRRALQDERPQAPVFFGVRLIPSRGAPKLERSLVWRRSLSAEAQACFGRPLNGGRHWLVSLLLQRGVSAWQVRVLTGHHRQFAEVFSDAMNHSPALALQELKQAMEQLFSELGLEYPARAARVPAKRTLVQPSGVMPRALSDRYLNTRLGNPWRVLPAPFDAWTCTALSAVQILRQAMCHGAALPSPGADFTGAQTLFGCLDSADQQVIFDTLPRSIVRVQSVAVMVWRRQDSVQDICMRMNDRSVLALARMGLKPAGTWRSSAAAFARWARGRLEQMTWPVDDFEAFQSLVALVNRVRRYEFPPSILSSACPAVPSATFSRRSVLRIAGQRQDPSQVGSLGQVVRRAASRSAVGGAGPLFDLAQAVRSVSYLTLPLGQEQQRARDWQASLAALDLEGDLRAHAWKAVQEEEIRLLLTGDKDRDETSTLAGHAGEVLVALSLLGPWDDPRCMEPEQFRELVQAATDAIDRDKTDTQAVRLQQTRWFGLKRFLKIGQRLGWRVPSGLFEGSAHRAGLEAMRRSAASVALLKEDFPLMRELLRNHFSAWPIDQRRADLALMLLHEHPLRSSEQTVLPVEALVPSSGRLVIENGSFSHLKSVHANRHLPCGPALLQALQQAQVDPAWPTSRHLFLPDDGHDWSAARAIDEALVSAAAQVTGEAAVRKHSFRAAAACRQLWPDWEDVAAGLLGGRWSPQRCLQWRSDDALRSVAVMQTAARSAGHGLPLVTLAYYAAAWPFMFTAHVQAGLDSCRLSSRLVEQALGSLDAFRRLQRRANSTDKPFDAWGAAAELCVQNFDLPPMAVLSEEAVLRPRAHDALTVEPCFEVRARFVALLLAGEHPELCADRLGIPQPYAQRLRALLPDSEALIDIRRRLGGCAKPSTLADDRALMESPVGQAMWAALLAGERHGVAELLQSLSPRRLNVRDRPPTAQDLIRRVRLMLQCLPPFLGLQIRFSASYPPTLSAEALAVCGERLVQGRPHPSIGRHPRFQVLALEHPHSPRLTGRLTVVARMFCEAIGIVSAAMRDQRLLAASTLTSEV